MTVDLCYFLAFKGIWAAQENKEGSFLKGWGLCSLLPLPLQECIGPHYSASAFHGIIWITKERHKMDGSHFISWHHGLSMNLLLRL